MYPNLYYAFKDMFGVDWQGLRFINSFGFFVALSFIAAAIVLTHELRRKGKQGLLTYEEEKIIIGKPASTTELIIHFLIGFLLGYKLLGAFLSSATITNPQEYIFSSQGNLFAGISIGILLAAVKWWERNKQKLVQPEERIIRRWPHDRVGDMVIFAAIFGFMGAKIFDNFENWDRFLEDPIGNLFGASGLTFYGGLICAALAIWWYARKHKIGFWHLNDAAAPALMLAYALGRIGCQVAGDGDWGINNTHFKGPSFLPDWLFAYTYPHNVNKEGIPIPGCGWDDYCTQLPVPVFPTPLYETIACLLLFFFLWSIRKKVKIPGYLFAIYLIVNGLERFFVEKIRVNTTYKSLPFNPTQAELISLFLFLAGVFLLIFLYLRRPIKNSTAKSVLP